MISSFLSGNVRAPQYRLLMPKTYFTPVRGCQGSSGTNILFGNLRSSAVFILVAMGECPQTCMNKLRIAPRSGAPAMLHTFVPRPASAALAALRCSVLMCGRSQMSARPDMQAYPSLRPLARCLFILIFLSPAHPCAARRIVSQKQNIRFQNTRFCERLFVSQYIILHLHPQDIFHKIQSDIFYNSGSCFSYRSCPSYLHNHTLIILQNIRRRFFSYISRIFIQKNKEISPGRNYPAFGTASGQPGSPGSISSSFFAMMTCLQNCFQYNLTSGCGQ